MCKPIVQNAAWIQADVCGHILPNKMRLRKEDMVLDLQKSNRSPHPQLQVKISTIRSAAMVLTRAAM